MQRFRAMVYAHVVNRDSCLKSTALCTTLTNTSWTRSSAAEGERTSRRTKL